MHLRRRYWRISNSRRIRPGLTFCRFPHRPYSLLALKERAGRSSLFHTHSRSPLVLFVDVVSLMHICSSNTPVLTFECTGVPMPHRRMTVYQSSYFSDGHEVPLGQREKDHGQGGFPGPIQLSQMVARRYVPQLYSGLKGLFGEIRRRDKKRVERLQDEFNKLIIGRNSDFNTEELSDEELEELGGLECVLLFPRVMFSILTSHDHRYRALRLLSYLVAFVRVYLSYPQTGRPHFWRNTVLRWDSINRVHSDSTLAVYDA